MMTHAPAADGPAPAATTVPDTLISNTQIPNVLIPDTRVANAPVQKKAGRVRGFFVGTSLLLATTSVIGVGAQPAEAEVVGACSGVRLPRSVVTDLIGNVLVPVLAPVESLLSLLGPVNLGLSSTLSNVASGAPIDLGAIDINGGSVDLLTDPGCKSQADSFALGTPKGLSIGGNSISGLGQSGLEASAGALDAIAIGDLAVTSVGANGAIAIGAGAVASHSGSIALGAGSLANGSSLSSSAYLVGGTAAAELNIGARRITGVAAGANATDAVNVAQLTIVNDAVASMASSSVHYDSAGRDLVTLQGASGTRIANVAAGAVSATSTDAVNGAQLHATNSNVTQLSVDLSVLDGLSVKYQDSSQSAIALGGASGTRISNVAAGVADSDAVTVAQLNAVSGSVGAVRNEALLYDTGVNAYNAARGGTDQRITGVAAGTVAAGSSDAVNGAQLADTNDRVTEVAQRTDAVSTSVATHLGGGATVQTNGSVSAPSYSISTVATNGTGGTATYTNVGDALTSLGTSVENVNQRIDTVARISDRAIAYDGAIGDPLDTVTFAGSDGTRLTNVKAGDISATSTDAVTGAQLHATNSQLAANTAVVTALREGTDGYFQVNNGAALPKPVATGAASTAAGAGAVASGDRGTALGTQAQALAANSVAVGSGSIADRPNSLSVGSAGAERQITNVADGTEATDAVNMRQLLVGMDQSVLSANAYTDNRFAQVSWEVHNLRRDAEAGTASAMALSAIPQPIEAGRGMIGFGTSIWQGQTAIAMGFSRASDNGRLIVKAGATYNSRSQGGANAGVGLAF